MFLKGLQNKLMRQVNLVRIGQKYLNKPGSITLIGGILNIHPILQGTSAAMVNGALDSFVKAASKELKKHRINLVSPTVFQESMNKFASFFEGYQPVKVAEAAEAYLACIEGTCKGEILRVGYTLTSI